MAMAKTTKTVTIIARYFIKRFGLVCYRVRNGGGTVYCVTLNPRKNTASCTCEGNDTYHRQCYHITHCLEAEAARNASKNVQAQKTEEKAAPVVAEASAIVQATERKYSTSEQRLAAPLNGNREFSLTRR